MFRSVRTTALITLWLVPLLIVIPALGSDWVATWKAVHVPSMLPSFLDLRSLTSSLTAVENGVDPLVANPYDPLHRTFNYPRIWIKLSSAFKLNDGNVWIVGLSFCFFYLLCTSHLIVRATRGLDVLIILALALSLSPLLAIERGNNDLAVFSLVFLGCILQNKYAKSGLFAAAALLKLFPIVALGIESIRRSSKQIRVPAFFASGAIVLLAAQFRDIDLIRRATPIARHMSYGVLSWKAGVEYQSAAHGLPIVLGNAVIIICCLAGMFGIVRGWNSRTGMETLRLDSQSAEMFCVFGAIFALTFVAGSNWDYRLIFLIPTLPFALEMLQLPNLKAWAAAYIASAAFAENAFGLEDQGRVFFLHLATLFIFAFILMVLTFQFKLFLSSSTTHVSGMRSSVYLFSHNG